MAHLLADETGFSQEEIMDVLNSLGYIVKTKFNESDNVEMKLFSGLKLSCEFKPIEEIGKGFCIGEKMVSKYCAFIKGVFTDHFKKEIKKNHCII